MKKTLLFALLTIVSLGALAQNNGDFRTRQTGNWNATSTWQRYNGTAWEAATSSPSSTDGVITIRSPHVVTVTAPVTIDQTVIESGGEMEITSGITLSIAGGTAVDIDLLIEGLLSNNGTLALDRTGFISARVNVQGVLENGNTITRASGTSLDFAAGSKYLHQQNGGQIPISNWNISSSCQVTGVTNSAPTGLNQNFGNFVWSCQSQIALIDLNGSLTTVGGDLSVLSTAGNGLAFTLGNSYALTIGGNFTANDFAAFNSDPGVTAVINIGGACLIESDIFFFTIDGDVTMNIDGDFKISGGIVEMTLEGAGSITLNVNGDVEISSSPTINNNGSGTYTLNFQGTSIQNYSSNVALADFDYIINSNAIVALDNNSFFAGSGDVIVENLGVLRVGSSLSSGAIQNSTTAGNIRVSGARAFASGSRIVYNGAAAQVIGNGFPTSGLVNLEIDNAAGVAMNGPLTIGENRQLILTSGALAIGSQTLTINGNLSGSGTITGGDNASLVLGGGGNPVNLNFTTYPTTLKDLVIDRNTEGPVIFGGNIQVLGTLSATEGIMDISGRNFQISGPYVGDNAEFRTNASTVLRVGGSAGVGFSGELKIQTGNTLDTLRINRAGVAVPTSSSFVARTLSLLAGTLMNSQNSIQMAAGGTVFRQSPGELQFAPGGANPYNLVYGAGTFNSGPELPGIPSAQLSNFTVDGSGTKTITKEIRINGNVNLNSGSLANAGFNVTMNGAEWNFNAGSYVPGTSLTRFSGNTVIGGTGIKQFGGLLCLAGSTLNLPQDKLGISGLFEVESGATVIHNNGTVVFNGGSNQSISAGGAALYNIEINKSGGLVDLVTPLDMIGTLDINSETVLNSRTEGNLRLLSTTDAGGGDARIAPLFPSASISGNVRIQRYMSGEGFVWRLLTPAVNNVKVADWQQFFKISGNFTGADPSVTGEPSMYIYDETVGGGLLERWIAYPTTDNGAPLIAGKGYMVAMSNNANPITVEVSGPVNQGVFDFVDKIGVTYTSSGVADNDGWNLLGNPFPSQIRWGSVGWTSSGTVGGTVYVEDDAAGIVRSFNGSTGSFNGNIAIGQGFWIKTSGASIELSADEQAKIDGTATFYRTEPLTNHLALTLKKNGTTQEDYTYIHYREDATNAYDHHADGYKRVNQIFGLYTMGDGGERLAINSRKLEDYISDTVVIGIMYIQAGNYTLEINDLNSFDWQYTFVLKDNLTNTLTEIPQSEEPFVFSFSVPEDLDFDDARFELYVKPIFTGLLAELESGVSIYPNPTKGLFNIRGISKENLHGLLIIDAQGRSIQLPMTSVEYDINEVQVNAGNLARGIYLLRMQLSTGVLMRKLVIE